MRGPWSSLTASKTLTTLCFLAALGGCHKQDEPSAVKGRVSVSGGNAAGTVVEVYAQPEFNDASVWWRTAATPQIGFPYSLQAAFDWRREQSNLRASATVGSDGGFELTGLADGGHVVVARKEGFGWSRPLGVAIQGGTEDVGVITLQAEVVVPSGTTITSDTTWGAGAHIVLARNLIVDAGATLTIGPGTVVRVGDRGRITVFGALHVEGAADNFAIITSDRLTQPLPSDWDYVNFVPAGATSQPPHFRYCTLSYAEDGIRSTTAGGTIEYCYLSDGGAIGANLTGSGSSGTEDSVVMRH